MADDMMRLPRSQMVALMAAVLAAGRRHGDDAAYSVFEPDANLKREAAAGLVEAADAIYDAALDHVQTASQAKPKAIVPPSESHFSV